MERIRKNGIFPALAALVLVLLLCSCKTLTPAVIATLDAQGDALAEYTEIANSSIKKNAELTDQEKSRALEIGTKILRAHNDLELLLGVKESGIKGPENGSD